VSDDALDLLLGPEGLGNFPFVDETDRGNATALLLLRHLIRLKGVRLDDGTPLHWIEAPRQGAGKSSLARLCTGERGVAWVRAEWVREKIINQTRLVPDVVTGPRSGVTFFDNVNERVQSSVLASAMTSGGPANVWVMTVQPSVTGSEDFIGPRGRAVRIRLTGEPPEGRLPAALSADPAKQETGRGELTAAAEELIRGWDEQGRPERSGPSVTRWRRWEAVVGGLLDLHGVPFLNAEGGSKAPSGTGDPVIDTLYALHGTKRVTTDELYLDPKFADVVRPLTRSWTVRGLSQLLQHRAKAGLLVREGSRPALWRVERPS
jgi:hypothetical protein